jgi:hypothetical protein
MFEIDNALQIIGQPTHLVGIEDKRSSQLPATVFELVNRGVSCRIVEVEVGQNRAGAPGEQPNWWVVANKVRFAATLR